MTALRRALTRITAALLLLALIVGIPIGLAIFGGNPLPETLPSWTQIQIWLTSPDSGQLLLSVLTIAGWLGWATFTIAVAAEIPAQLRGLPRPRIPGLSLQQRAAGALVGAILLGARVGPAIASNAPAHAHTGPSAAAGTIAVMETTTQDITNDEAAAGEVEEPEQTEAAQPEHPVHVVAAGESLWSIAQDELGSGDRWVEIADLNYGLTQPGGHSLQPGEHWIDPGWELLLPAPVQTQPAAAPAEDLGEDATETHQVQAGDHLWGIAEERLGDGARWTEIYQASTGITQPAGQHLSDPDLLHPGWQLAIPGATSQAQTEQTSRAEQPEPTSAQPEPEAEVAPETTTGQGAPEYAMVPDTDQAADPAGGEVAPVQASEPVPEVDQGSEESESSNVRTIGGAGALLAAGVLGLLAIKRGRAQRTRAPGQRLTMPEGEASVVEEHLRAVADPLGRETVDEALRDLGAWHQREGLPLPDVRAARLTADAFHLYLATPAQLPAPWEAAADRCVWSLPAHSADQRTTTEAERADAGAPFPSLITLGHDEEDAHLLLDLEHLEHLDIRGDTEASHATLAALAVELATSPWADDLQVTLVGTLPGLADVVDTGRLRYVTGLDQVTRELTRRAEDVGQILTDAGVDSLTQARGRRLATDTWTPEILLIGTALPDHVRNELDALVSRVPRVGIAAVTTDTQTGDWVLDLDPDAPGEAVLSPTDLRIRPQQLTTADYAQILTVLSGTEQTQPGPTWAAHLEQLHATDDITQLPEVIDRDADTEIIITPNVDEAIQDEAASAPSAEGLADTSPQEQQDDQQHDQDHQPEQDGDVEHDEVAVRVEDEVVEADADDQAIAQVHELRPPLLQVLGPVDITVGTNAPPPPKAVEIVAFLTLNTNVTSQRFSEALWPGKEPSMATRNSAVSRARNWLGTNPGGEQYVPYIPDDGLYRVHGINSDWDAFTALLGQDAATTPLPQLMRALDLVRGRPFQGAQAAAGPKRRADRFSWAEPHIQEMVSTIVDVAHAASYRARATGEPTTAIQAAKIGLDALDEHEVIETLWQDLIRATWAAGDTTTVHTLIDDLYDRLETIEADPTPETTDLITAINRAGTTEAAAI